MTGRRPDTTQIWNLDQNWRVKHQNWTSLPGMFLAGDMLSLGCGKTYHDTVQDGLENALFEYDHKRSWSPEALPYRNPCWTQGVDCGGCPNRDKPDEELGSPERWSINNVSVDWCERVTGDLSDVFTTNVAIDLMNTAVSSNKSFYLAVGYHKPHMPWIAKPEHFDLYPMDNVSITTVKILDLSVPPIAFNSNNSPSPYQAITDTQARTARRAYYAATTGMDEQVGLLLAGLENFGLTDTTAVILHGDNGFQLGERAGWLKNANWESAVRVPFIISVPWLSTQQGVHSSALVELIDIMPTLADLAGVSVPGALPGDAAQPPEGTSLLPLLQDPTTTVKDYAFSQYPRKPKEGQPDWESNGIDHDDPSLFIYMGYSVRSDDWRYTEWRVWDGTALKVANWDDVAYATELYDWRQCDAQCNADMDYDSWELINVVNATENEDVVAQLSSVLRAQFDI
jgi:iduronate 2-sulfatase